MRAITASKLSARFSLQFTRELIDGLVENDITPLKTTSSSSEDTFLAKILSELRAVDR